MASLVAALEYIFSCPSSPNVALGTPPPFLSCSSGLPLQPLRTPCFLWCAPPSSSPLSYVDAVAPCIVVFYFGAPLRCCVSPDRSSSVITGSTPVHSSVVAADVNVVPPGRPSEVVADGAPVPPIVVDS